MFYVIKYVDTYVCRLTRAEGYRKKMTLSYIIFIFIFQIGKKQEESGPVFYIIIFF